MATIDFIGIGAQKAGSTWLFRRLREHPDFSLPPIKEFHYFSRGQEYICPKMLSKIRLEDRMSNENWLNRAQNRIKALQQRGRVADAIWLVRYFFSDYDDHWYLSLFEDFNGITGEISPSYSLLKQHDIERMKILIPNVKIVLLLRNPVERAWSHFRFKREKKIDLKKIDQIADEIIAFIDSPEQEVRSDYVGILTNYTRLFQSDQMIVGFYDCLQEKPNELFNLIVKFLGGDPTKTEGNCKILQKDHVSKDIPIPNSVMEHLKMKYKPQIESLAGKYGGYFCKWHTDLFGVESPSQKLSPVLKF